MKSTAAYNPELLAAQGANFEEVSSAKLSDTDITALCTDQYRMHQNPQVRCFTTNELCRLVDACIEHVRVRCRERIFTVTLKIFRGTATEQPTPASGARSPIRTEPATIPILSKSTAKDS